MSYIYKYTNILNNKVYIGQTIQTTNKRAGKNGNRYTKNNTHFSNAIKKYGWDAFVLEILIETDDNSILDDLERYFIKKYNATDREYGYNTEIGGNSNKTISEETKRKISNTLTGHIHSEETKEKIGFSHKGMNYSVRHILQYDLNNNFVAEWNSIRDAENALNVKNQIGRCCLGKRKTACGFIWKFKN